MLEHLKEQLHTLKYNPSAMQRQILDALEFVSDGHITTYDPSNPFIFLLESAVTSNASTLMGMESIHKDLYPSLSMTREDLYRHMSDVDYLDLFATPSRTTFTLLIHKEEFLSIAVPSEQEGIYKLTIPRYSEFGLGHLIFTLLYPIDILIYSHGGIQILYDTRKITPIQRLESNRVDWRTVILQHQEYLELKIPLYQTQIATYFGHINKISGLTKTYSFTDEFYFCKAYRSAPNKTWEEIKVTHSEYIYDPLVPTVVIQLLDKKLRVQVPYIYIDKEWINEEIRIDIYTTKGPVDLRTDHFKLSEFTFTLGNRVREPMTPYTSPLSTFTTLAVYSDTSIRGGALGVDLPTLRERVIQNATGRSKLPITHTQLDAQLERLGYRVILDIDNLTQRIYLATKPLPSASKRADLSAAGSLIQPLQKTFDDIQSLPGIYDHGTRITLSPDILYEYKNGVINAITVQERHRIKEWSTDKLIKEVNERNFLFCPFHYVLDASQNYFVSRIYYLDHPSVGYRYFIEDNPAIEMNVNTHKTYWTRKPEGYKLTLITDSGQRLKQLANDRLIAVLSFRPLGESRDVHLRSHFIQRQNDGEWALGFTLKSEWDLDHQDSIDLTNFLMYPNQERSYRCPLETQFKITYYVRPGDYLDQTLPYLTYRESDVVIPHHFISLTHEHLTLTLGQRLKHFWNRARSIMGPKDYQTHPYDVLAFYDNNIYKRDPITGTPEISIGNDGKLQFTILHKKGDPVLDEDGHQVYLHRKGDPILDHNKKPLPINERKILREWEMFFMDGRYYFCNDPSLKEYLKEIPIMITDWVGKDLKTFRDWALEQTELYFYPENTMGIAEVTIEDGVLHWMDMHQPFNVTVYLSREKYGQEHIHELIERTTLKTIKDYLHRQRFVLSELNQLLSYQLREDIIGLTIDPIGENKDIRLLSISSDKERLNIKKRLIATEDNTLTLINDLTVNFIRHEI